jgi:hypothetical protein
MQRFCFYWWIVANYSQISQNTAFCQKNGIQSERIRNKFHYSLCQGASNCLRICGSSLCVSAILLAGAVTTKICLNRMARQLEREMQKGSVHGASFCSLSIAVCIGIWGMVWCIFSDWSVKILYEVCMHVIGDVKKIWVHKWKVSCMYCWCNVAVGCVSAVLEVRTSWIFIKICH